MKSIFASGLAILALGGCDQLQKTSAKTVEYRPEEAGTVDHALCLLGFRATPLQEVATGHHLVAAKLNGRDALFVLDTGANASVLHAPHADAFGLADRIAAPAAAIGLGGSMKASLARIDDLEIGGVPIRQRRIMIADLSQLSRLLEPMAGETIHGIIGQDVMAEHRAVIDVARPILHLIEADEEPAPVPKDRCSPSEEAAPGKED